MMLRLNYCFTINLLFKASLLTEELHLSCPLGVNCLHGACYLRANVIFFQGSSLKPAVTLVRLERAG